MGLFVLVSGLSWASEFFIHGLASGLNIGHGARVILARLFRCGPFTWPFLALVATCRWGFSADPDVAATDLPRIPATPLDAVAATFQMKPGFEFQLVAGEPLLADPVAIEFDERGRMFVVEMRDYSERRDERMGRIRMLEDTDGDGRYDKSTVFAENLPWPTALLCYDGGLFVGSTPDILYLKDTDGDGHADSRRVIFTGFAEASLQHLNVQALLNSFHWGLDQRVHGSASVSGGNIRRPDHPEIKAVELRGHDFSFDPKTLEFRRETGGGQHGMSFDNYGRKFLCSNSDHIQAVIYDDRYVGGNPWADLPSAHESIAADGPAAEVFRISPDEPWRVIRTRWRVTGAVPGLIEGGGRPSGYFTGATGVTLYRGDALPSDFLGDAFVADCGSNLIHHKKVRPVGLSFVAERAADERRSEFIASRDNWFRPVQFVNAPDGSLFVADMYREVIEHPWSLPESIKKHLDLNSGNDRGRIYRIAPAGFKSKPAPDLSRLASAELVALLAHPNAWHRDTASRLLMERHDSSTVSLLNRLIEESTSELGRLHALWVLHGVASLEPSMLLTALADRSPRVRENAIRLVEELPASQWNGEFSKRLEILSSDADLRVKAQLAWSLSKITLPQKTDLLHRLALQSLTHTELIGPILNASSEAAVTLFGKVGADTSTSLEPVPLLNAFGRMIALRHRGDEVPALMTEVAGWKPSARSIAVLAASGEGLERAGQPFPDEGSVVGLPSHLGLAKDWARGVSPEGGTVSVRDRVSAIRLLGFLPEKSFSEVVQLAFFSQGSSEVQRAALSSLGRGQSVETAASLLARASVLPPEVRADLLALMVKKQSWRPALVEALEKGQLSRTELSIDQLQRLRADGNPSLQERVVRLLGVARTGQRQEVINRFLPALAKTGSSSEGSKIYDQRCALCHRSGGRGRAIGPDFDSVRSMGKEKLLTQILDPNREVAPSYLAYLAETKSGDSIQGLLISETPDRIRLKATDGTETSLERSQLKSFAPTGLSLMPEGLEEGLGEQQIADLLAFIVSP